MKTLKTFKNLSLGLMALASVGTASATPSTIVHLVGSTAFRAPATAAIIDTLSAGGTTPVFAAYSGSSLLGAGSAVIANGTLGANGTATIAVETYFTGSLAGVVDLVAGNSTGLYLDSTNANIITAVNGSTVSTSPYGGGTALTGTIATVSAVPDIAMSDSFKGTIANELSTATLTAPIGSYTTIAALAAACGGSSVVDGGTSANASGAGFVGIVPFEWLAGNGSPAITSISQQTSRGLITNGFVPQSYFTGTSTAADTANYFYLVGRNEDSGTRIGAFSEAQFGVTNSPTQFNLAAVNGTETASLYPVTPLNTEPNIVWKAVGHSGFASGSNVASALDVAGGNIAFASGKSGENTGSSYFIGYVGITDAATALAGGAHALSYGGVPFSVTAVENGQYTFWTYEHSYHLSSLSGTPLTVANTIADNIYLTDADVAGNGTHSSVSGATAAGILDNSNSPVLVFRPFVEGQPLSNY